MASDNILREAIRENTSTLLETIDPKDIIGHLYQDRALSDVECEDILSAKTRHDRTWKLLYHLRHRDPKRQPFNIFVESLKKDHDFLAEIIERTVTSLRQRQCHQNSGHVAGHSHNHDVNRRIICHRCHQNISENNSQGQNTRPSTALVSTTCSQRLSCIDSDGDEQHQCSNISQQSTLEELHNQLQGILPDKNTLQGLKGLEIADGETSETESESDFGGYEARTNQNDQFNAMFSTFNLSEPSSDNEDRISDNDVEDDEEEEEWEPDTVFAEQFGEYFHQRLRLLSTSSTESGYRPGSSSAASMVDFELESQLIMRSVSSMRPMPSANGGRLHRSRQMKLIFDKLSSVINAGGFEQFKRQRDKILELRPRDADLMCILLYLEACTHLFKGNLRDCEKVVERAIEFVPYTSNPSKVMVEIFSLKCWMYLKENKLNALEYHLSDAAQIIAQDPMAVAGKAAGWLYVDEARRLIPLLTSNNLARSYSIRDKAIKCLERALEQFKSDDSKDGPFGYHFAVIKLSMLLLGCGELMQTTDLQPTEKDLVRAAKCLREVENSCIGLPAILRLQYCMAMSDLHYRRHNLARALDYAQEAFKLTKGLNMPEETRCARVRRDFHRNLKSQSLEHSHINSGGKSTNRDPKRNPKYLSSTDSDVELIEVDHPQAYLETDFAKLGPKVRKSTRLSYFFRLWLVIVLLSASWIFSETM